MTFLWEGMEALSMPGVALTSQCLLNSHRSLKALIFPTENHRLQILPGLNSVWHLQKLDFPLATLSYGKSELLKKPLTQWTFWSCGSLAGDYWARCCSTACGVVVKLESCMVAVVGSLNRLLQFGWKEHANSRSPSGGWGKTEWD